jgi:hypothetical protein
VRIRLRPRLTYANVISTLCLFLLIGGSAYAASKVGKNSVGTKQIKNGAVTAAKLKRNSVSTAKLQDNSVSTAKLQADAVTGAKVQDGSLSGADIANGSISPSNLSGPSPTAPGDPLPSGRTETGAWAILDGLSTAPATTGIGLPFPAPVALSDATVNFEANTNGIASDDDPVCTGTSQTPTAPRGKVCIYIAVGQTNVGALSGKAVGSPGPSSVGFVVTSTTSGTGQAQGTWAYTAP